MSFACRKFRACGGFHQAVPELTTLCENRYPVRGWVASIGVCLDPKTDQVWVQILNSDPKTREKHKCYGRKHLLH